MGFKEDYVKCPNCGSGLKIIDDEHMGMMAEIRSVTHDNNKTSEDKLSEIAMYLKQMLDNQNQALLNPKLEVDK